ncbi:MAG: TIGR04282 family arsenosugar biosynthesis glycosyltransferase [Nitrospirae bacterium]|nr:TIGR04282 family arsenosugar biosynthesis glycosyltransferase [Nitrospirota bacterium]
MSDLSVVLLFVKSPERGKVKSRLGNAIGDDMALDVYRCLVSNTLDMLGAGKYDVRLCFYPPDSHGVVEDWLGSGHCYVPQQGGDIGERMKNAFVQAFSEGVEKAVLIGSDIPDLSISLINEAVSALDISDAVIGPAHDGGYYLIGFNRHSFLANIFQGIVWSTGSVYHETMNIFGQSGSRVHVLTGLSDVDTLGDLLSFYERYSAKRGGHDGT